ncbi:MAG: hypothetical protein ACYTBJ_04685 [Planctomycetota bacterium]|jgi:hypothetical protein
MPHTAFWRFFWDSQITVGKGFRLRDARKGQILDEALAGRRTAGENGGWEGKGRIKERELIAEDTEVEQELRFGLERM